MGVADLDIVAEDVVIADFERRDARRLAFALLNARKVILAVERDAPILMRMGFLPMVWFMWMRTATFLMITV